MQGHAHVVVGARLEQAAAVVVEVAAVANEVVVVVLDAVVRHESFH